MAVYALNNEDIAVEKIADLIYKEAGIKVERHKFNVLKTKLRLFMKKRGYNSFEEVLKAVERSKFTFDDMISFITVNETYFYREIEHFEVLVKLVKEKGQRSVKILSLPCSTGEEPFTIVIFMLEAFGKFFGLKVVGVDVDRRAIEIAKEGLYSDRSVSKVPKDIIKKYFIVEDGVYRIKPELKKYVQFQKGNIFDKRFLKSLGLFDYIFCRNLLIYFDHAKRKEALLNLYEILKDDGFLFIGKTESIIALNVPFERVTKNGIRIYRKVVKK